MEDINWRRTVTNVSDKLFPGISAYNKTHQEVNLVNIDDEITSSLPLQMSLYFNVMFFPFWLTSSIVMLHIKFDCLSLMYQFILVTVLVTMIGIESLRLYLGFMGNLTEKLPELAGFLMLSVLLQLPLQLFLLVNQNVLPQLLEYAVHLVMMSLLLVQLVSGFVAIRNAAQHQTDEFRRMQFITHNELSTRRKDE